MGTGELEGRVALVTGGGRGIGRAVVLRLAGAGARVALTCRTADQGRETVAAVEAAGSEALYLQADQASDADWTRVVAQTTQRFGQLDVLAICAGVNPSARIVDETVEAFDAQCAINLKGVFLGLKHGVGAIRAGGRGGSVILVGSIVGLIGAPGYGAYTASKDGVRLLAKAAALELGPERIRVNSLHPGFVDTDMTAGFPRAAMEAMVPLKRYGRPEEMADAVLFLASDRSRFMTGAELVADGGMTAQ